MENKQICNLLLQSSQAQTEALRATIQQLTETVNRLQVGVLSHLINNARGTATPAEPAVSLRKLRLFIYDKIYQRDDDQ